MTNGLTVLAPLIAVCVAIGVLLLGTACYREWRRWPKHGPPSPYGEFRPDDVRRITEQANKR